MSGSLNVWEPARAKTIGDWPAFCGGGVHVLGRDGEWHAAVCIFLYGTGKLFEVWDRS